MRRIGFFETSGKVMRIGFAICAGKWQLLPSRPDPTTSPIHDDDDDDNDDNDDGDDDDDDDNHGGRP